MTEKSLVFTPSMISDTIKMLTLEIFDCDGDMRNAYHRVGKNGKQLSEASAQTMFQKKRDRLLQLTLVKELFEGYKPSAQHTYRQPELFEKAQKGLQRLLFPKERSR